MVYDVFSVEKGKANKIDEILKDDIVSRQSITVRDASSIDIEGDIRFVLIEGTAPALERARELFKDIAQIETGEKKEKIYTKIKSTEEASEVGIGMIFED